MYIMNMTALNLLSCREHPRSVMTTHVQGPPRRCSLFLRSFSLCFYFANSTLSFPQFKDLQIGLTGEKKSTDVHQKMAPDEFA